MGNKQKTPNYGMLRGMPVLDRMNFVLADDHIETGAGAAKREYYYLRMEPRNMDILSPTESKKEYQLLQSILDKDGLVPSFMSLDKTEGLDDIRQFYEGLTQQYPEYERINGAILQHLSGLEAEESSIVERAHYMILRCRNRSEYRQFDQIASTYLNYHLAERAELLVLLKNFLLRDYTPAELAEWDDDIRLKYETLRSEVATKPKKRKLLPEEEAFAQQEMLRLLLPSHLHFDSRYIEQGTLYRKTMRVRGYPAELAHAGALNEIGSMASVTLRIYLEPISMLETNAMLTRQINQRTSTMLGARKASERVRGGMEKDQVEDAYKGQLRRQSKMYYVTILTEVYGSSPEDLRMRAENIRTIFASLGFIADDMYYEQREGFISMLPYGVNLADTFKRNMPTKTISELYPFSASRKTDEKGLILGKTSTGSPFFWDPYMRTREITNGVILLAGSSGQGKSYLQKKILAQLIARKSKAFTLDAENEYLDLFDRCGGTNQDCAGGGVRINPLEVRRLADQSIEKQFHPEETENDPEAFTGASALLQHLNWLSAFHQMLLPGLNAAQQTTLQVLLQRHYEQKGIKEDFDPHGKEAGTYPTYSSLYEYIEDIFDRFDDLNEEVKLFAKEDLRQILLALKGLTNGARSAIFNGATNVQNTDVINFVVSGLLTGDEQTRDAGLFNVLSWIWNQVVSYREPLIFAVDELYLYLNPVVVEYLRNFAKRARKYNAIMLMTTQNLSDFNDPAIIHMCQPLFELAIHKFLFYPGDVNRDAMKTLMQLTDSELDIISNSRQRHCLVKCGTEKFHLTVGTLPYEQYLFGDAGGYIA